MIVTVLSGGPACILHPLSFPQFL